MNSERAAFDRWYDPYYLGDHSEKDAVTRAYAWAGWQAASATKVDRWQPIESAPKDGTRVLVWDGEEWLARWQAYNGGYWDADEYISENPTHWMPLPAPPLENKE